MYKKNNDYELLYLINWHSEEALRLLLNKYSYLVNAKLVAFKIRRSHYEDFYQECMLVIYKAIDIYNERYNKSFCRFLELLIERKIIKLLLKDSKNINAILVDNISDLKDHNNIWQQIEYEKILESIKNFKDIESKKWLLNDYFVNELSINDIMEKYDLSKKEIYNQLYLLRLKLKKKIE